MEKILLALIEHAECPKCGSKYITARNMKPLKPRKVLIFQFHLDVKIAIRLNHRLSEDFKICGIKSIQLK